MFILVVTIHVIVSLVIIGLVLLQAGKGADIGSAFGGSGSQAVFGSMGTPTVLGKATAVVGDRLHDHLVRARHDVASSAPASCPRRGPPRPRPRRARRSRARHPRAPTPPAPQK